MTTERIELPSLAWSGPWRVRTSDQRIMRDRAGVATNRQDPHRGATAPRTSEGTRSNVQRVAPSSEQLVTATVTTGGAERAPEATGPSESRRWPFALRAGSQGATGAP